MIRPSTLITLRPSGFFTILNQLLRPDFLRKPAVENRAAFRLIIGLFTIIGLAACQNGASSAVQRAPFPGQGQYVYPQYLRPQPTLYIPQSDECRAQLYAGLVGQHIGGVHITAIGGDKRIIKPAVLEVDEDDFLIDMRPEPPFLEITELLAGQPLYAASIRTGVYPGMLGPDRTDRLTIELDADGYIQTLECR